MQRLQVADAKMMEMALKNEILRSEEARYDHRLHGVLLVCSATSDYGRTHLRDINGPTPKLHVFNSVRR